MNWLARKFHFSPSERRGTIVLLFLLLILAIVRSLPSKEFKYDVDFFLSRGDTLTQVSFSEISKESRANSGLSISNKFDPNYLSAKNMYQMGFEQDWVDRVFTFKREKGYIKDSNDFKLLCGDDTLMHRALIKYIEFKNSPTAHRYKRSTTTSPKAEYAAPESFQNISKSDNRDLNSMTIEDFQKFHGIGPSLSARIAKFREKLGGFNSPHQLFEVYGLDSSVVETVLQQCSIEAGHDSLRINEMSWHELSQHPYLDRNLSRAITAFKNQHGPIKSMSQLKKIVLWDSIKHAKVVPYISFES